MNSEFSFVYTSLEEVFELNGISLFFAVILRFFDFFLAPAFLETRILVILTAVQLYVAQCQCNHWRSSRKYHELHQGPYCFPIRFFFALVE